MNTSIMGKLILKDWYFLRLIIASGVFLGVVSLGLIRFGNSVGFYMGSIMLITVVIGLGLFLIFETVINERKHQTLPFIMSLPISTKEYTTAKILANLLIFLVPWVILVIGSVIVISNREAIPNGFIPFTLLVLVEILTCHCLILATAIITESQGWTIGVMAVCNLFLQFFLYTVSKLEGIKATIEGPDAIWSSSFFMILGIEVLAIAIFIGVTFFLQSRKKDFL